MAGPSGPAILFNFYPRSPCGERPQHQKACGVLDQFLSTLSLRRATQSCYIFRWQLCLFLSTLSLRRATAYRVQLGSMVSISIHALLAESDMGRHWQIKEDRRFLSTLSLRRATHRSQKQRRQNSLFLSTLSLRRATMTTNISNLKVFYFYPRSPCGERRSFFKRLFGIHEEFLSTLSLRRATAGA